MVSQDPNQQGTSPKPVHNVNNTSEMAIDQSELRYPGANLCWKLMCEMKAERTRADVARWSFRFGSTRKRGNLNSRCMKERQTGLGVIDEEPRRPLNNNIVADRVVLPPPQEQQPLSSPVKQPAPPPDPVPSPESASAPHPSIKPRVRPYVPLEKPKTDREPLPLGYQKDLNTVRREMDTLTLNERMQLQAGNQSYWRNEARKRKREAEQAHEDWLAEERVHRAAYMKTNPFADAYMKTPSLSLEQRQAHNLAKQQSRNLAQLQAQNLARTQTGAPRPVNLQTPRIPEITQRSGRFVVTNVAGRKSSRKCGFCLRLATCTRHRVYSKRNRNYEFIELCLTCEVRKNQGDILQDVGDDIEEEVEEEVFDGQSATPMDIDTGAPSVGVQVEAVVASVHSSEPPVDAVPNVLQNVRQTIHQDVLAPAQPQPGRDYYKMLWTDNPLRHIVQNAVQQATSFDYLNFNSLLSDEPRQEQDQPQQPEAQLPQAQQPEVQQVQPVPYPQLPVQPAPVQPAPAPVAAPTPDPAPAPTVRQIAIPVTRRRRQTAQTSQAAQQARPARSRQARKVNVLGPNDPRLFYGFLA